MSAGMVVVAPTVVSHASVAPVAASAIGGLVPVAAVAGIVIVGTVAAVLATRAVLAGARALGSALDGLEDAMRDADQCQLAVDRLAAETEARWQLAAAAVTEVNIGRQLLVAGMRRSGVTDLAVPPPVRLEGRTLGEVLADCRASDAAIATLRDRLMMARAKDAQARTAATFPGDRDRIASSMADWLERHRRRSVTPEPAVSAPTVPDDPPPTPDIGAQVDHWLGRLDREADTTDLERVMAAATRAGSTGRSQYVTELGHRVQQINRRLDRYRQHAQEAAAYIEALTAPGTDPAGPDTGPVLAELRRVVDDDADLTEDLRGRSRDLVIALEAAAVRRNQAEQRRIAAGLVRSELRSRGFDVHEDFRTADSAFDVLVVSAPGRPDHSATVSVSAHQVSYYASAHRAAGGDDEQRAGDEFCAGVSAGLDQVGHRLADAGLGTTVHRTSDHIRRDARTTTRRRPDDAAHTVPRERRP